MLRILLLIKNLFSGKGNVGSQLLSIGLIGVILIALYFVFFKEDKTFRNIQPAALLKKIEYVEQLKLVTYYYEEIIILGTKRRVEKIVERQQAKVEQAEKELFLREFELMQIEAKLDTINEQMFKTMGQDSSFQQLIKAEQNLKKARILFHSMDRDFSEFSKIKKDLDKDANFYGPQVAKAFISYRQIDAALQAAKQVKRRNLDRQGRKDNTALKDRLSQQLAFQEIDLKSAIRVEKSNRRILLSKYMDEVREKKFDIDNRQKKLKNRKKNTEKALSKARKAYDKATNDLEEKKAKLLQAQEELNLAKEQEDHIDPKLLIVVPAQITAYIDMREVQTDTDFFTGASLQVKLPTPKLDSVIISLDSTDHYELSNKFEVDLTSKGVYYDIYQQLKDAILEKEVVVKEKALNEGIVKETHEMAAEYIKGFAATLGYSVRFVDAISKDTAGVQTEAFMPDSTVYSPDRQLLNDSIHTTNDSMLEEIDHHE